MQHVCFTLQIEDLTGKGQQDLADGIVRTPLPAHETFQDGAVLAAAPLQPCLSLIVACLAAFEPQFPWTCGSLALASLLAELTSLFAEMDAATPAVGVLCMM